MTRNRISKEMIDKKFVGEVDGLSQQLAETSSELDSKITRIESEKANKVELQAVANGSPKGAFATLSDLQSALPSGDSGIYVVSADGNWYYWNGAEWNSGGQYFTTQWVSALTVENEPWEVV